jgi:hypothetical protein
MLPRNHRSWVVIEKNMHFHDTQSMLAVWCTHVLILFWIEMIYCILVFLVLQMYLYCFGLRWSGVIHLLHFSFPGATNETLLSKFNHHHKGKTYYQVPNVREEAFAVLHYAGKVKYQIKVSSECPRGGLHCSSLRWQSQISNQGKFRMSARRPSLFFTTLAKSNIKSR